MIVLTVQPGVEGAGALTTIKLIATRFPGEHELTILVPMGCCARCGMAEGQHPVRCRCAVFVPEVRRLALGPAWMYDASLACMAALAEFGRPELARV